MFSAFLNRENKPLIHNITNYVTANDVANAELALGGLPVMADSPEETAEITASADALNLNIGTLNPERLKAMRCSGRIASKKGMPVLLDLVGAGASEFRKKSAKLLTEELSPYIIKGNTSELAAVITGGDSRGVDARQGEKADADMLRAFAKRTGAVVVATGKEDIITDGNRFCIVKNGSEMMTKITGAGCMLSGILAVMLARSSDAFDAAVAGVVISGVSAELAEERMIHGDGTGSFKVYLMDAFSGITAEKIKEKGRYEA